MHSEEEVIFQTDEQVTFFIYHVQVSLILGVASSNFIALVKCDIYSTNHVVYPIMVKFFAQKFI